MKCGKRTLGDDSRGGIPFSATDLAGPIPLSLMLRKIEIGLSVPDVDGLRTVPDGLADLQGTEVRQIFLAPRSM
jgi:hypothetical protein